VLLIKDAEKKAMDVAIIAGFRVAVPMPDL
jgi:hypothetical protein